MSVRILQYSKC